MLNRLIEAQKKSSIKHRVLLILDDIIDTKNSVHQSGILDFLASNGRHLNIYVIITSQYINAVSPIMRNNCDMIFCFKTISKKCVELIIENFLGSYI